MNKVLAVLATLMLPSLAMAEGQPPQMGAMSQLIFFGGFILIFYFLLWRPQSKRAKEHRNLLDALQKGTEVVTSGGLVGKVTKVQEQFVVVKLAENMEVPVQKSAIAAELPKGTVKGIMS